MALNDKLISIRQAFFDKVEEFAINFATKFGYPENPGMPLIPPRVGVDGEPYLGFKIYDSDILTVRTVPFPPQPTAENLIELLFGNLPKLQPLNRLFYESKTDGFYSFYIENYKNLIFLPNWFSEFLQIHLNFCLDITFLEVFREVLFLSIMGYGEIVSFRILLAWIISINPYTFPWNYFVALVDWTEETLLGLVPSILAVNFSGPILLLIIGRCADSLNNVVFTMPYLPSEGEPLKIYIDGNVRNVLAFRYLPILWYKYPIPNEIRQYWYTQRPDILKYMQKAYKDVDIQFLPDEVIQKNNSTLIQEIEPNTEIESLSEKEIELNSTESIDLNSIDLKEQIVPEELSPEKIILKQLDLDILRQRYIERNEIEASFQASNHFFDLDPSLSLDGNNIHNFSHSLIDFPETISDFLDIFI
jgi:hypothetical protein